MSTESATPTPGFPARTERSTQDRTQARVSKPKPKAKKTPEEKAANKKRKKEAAAKKDNQRTVRHTVNLANGGELHLCEDDKWRTNSDLLDLGN